MLAPLIDTHCHLADPRLIGDVEAVLSRAASAGITRIISVGAIDTIETDQRTVEIARQHASVFGVIGIHPHNASDCSDERIGQIRELAKDRRVVAIGETGLDFHYMRSPAPAQEESFRRHLELSRELKLPIVIHCRDAEDRAIEILRETGIPGAGGVIHCFTGNRAAAERFLELGFFISFSGIVTFKNAKDIREAAQIVPRDRILVETDAPYLAPEPYRGKANEPSFVRLTAERLAAIRQQDSSELCGQLTANAEGFFALNQHPPI